MSRSDSSRPGNTPGAETMRVGTHTSSDVTSYQDETLPGKPTLPPSYFEDNALWPGWTKVDVMVLNLDLFDGNGHPIVEAGEFDSDGETEGGFSS